MSESNSSWKDYGLLHFIVLIWSITAILGKLISIPSVEVVFYRTLFAAIGLAILLKIRKRSFQIGYQAILKMIATGALIAGHWILFFAAARVSTVSVCLAGIATCSLWTSFLDPLFNGRKIQFFEVFLSMIAIIGIVVIFRVEFDHTIGLVMAIISAFLAAVFTIINAGFVKKFNPYTITFYEMVGACLSIILFSPFYSLYIVEEPLQLIPQGLDLVYLLILSLLCTVYAYSVSVQLMKRLSAFVINLTVNLEPVYGIILALIIFREDEEMSGGFYWGTALILVSVLLYPIINKILKSNKFKRNRLVH